MDGASVIRAVRGAATGQEGRRILGISGGLAGSLAIDTNRPGDFRHWGLIADSSPLSEP